MSVMLFIAGAIAIMAGATLIGFGIPINEFSFGNTLILAGAIVFMGGLVILALATLSSHLHRILEALTVRPALRQGKPMEPLDHAAMRTPAPAPARVPFPPKPKAEPKSVEMRPAHEDEPSTEAPTADAGLSFPPTLPNPDEAPAAGATQPAGEEPGMPPKSEPADAGWRAPPPFPPMRAPQTSFFETMWPASKPRQAESPMASEPKSDFRFEPRPEPKSEFHVEPQPEIQSEPAEHEPPIVPAHEPEAPRPESISEKRGIAVLKAGVVDGMGYTLYVDGSIEAELPQGTLHFASINELRAHLEKHT